MISSVYPHMLCALFMFVLTACSTTSHKSTKVSQPMTSISIITQQYQDTSQLMSKGEGDRVSSFYMNNALYVNAAGMTFEGVDVISQFVAGAKKANVEKMVFNDIKMHQAKSGVYVHSGFSFTMKLPTMPKRITLTGQRMSLWQKTENKWKMRVDVWLPGTPESDATTALFKSVQGTVLNAWQSNDYAKLGTLYAKNTTIVLSDGSVKSGETQRQQFLDLSKQLNVANYTTTLKRATPVSNTLFFGQTDYAFTMSPSPEKTLKLSGCRLVLWEKQGDEWKMLLDFAHPSISVMTIVFMAQLARH